MQLGMSYKLYSPLVVTHSDIKFKPHVFYNHFYGAIFTSHVFDVRGVIVLTLSVCLTTERHEGQVEGYLGQVRR